MNHIGIDYSLTCPAICVFDGDCPSLDKIRGSFLSNCKFYFLTDRKKFELTGPQFFGHPHKQYKHSAERYEQIADFILSWIPNESKISLEGYSFGSRGGRAFDIGEATGLLKYKLYKLNHNVTIIPPTVVKKYATGKGNADKYKMAEAFKQETQRDLYFELNCSEGKSPVSDIIDSYYLCKMSYNEAK
jgi:hypothetical protein